MCVLGRRREAWRGLTAKYNGHANFFSRPQSVGRTGAPVRRIIERLETPLHLFLSLAPRESIEGLTLGLDWARESFVVFLSDVVKLPEKLPARVAGS